MILEYNYLKYFLKYNFMPKVNWLWAKFENMESPAWEKNKVDFRKIFRERVEEYIDSEIHKTPNIFDAIDFNTFTNDEFEKFLSKKWYLSDFPGKFLKQDFCKLTLKNSISHHVSQRKKLYTTLEKVFKWQFHLDHVVSYKWTNKRLADVIDAEYIQLSLWELRKMCTSYVLRNNFLKTKFGLKTEDIENISIENENENKILQDIFWWIAKLNIQQLSANEQAMSALQALQKRQKVFFPDLEQFFSLLDIEWKKALLTYFIPVISLQQAFDSWIISQAYQNQVFRAYTSANDIDIENIFIDTQSIDNVELDNFFQSPDQKKVISKISDEYNQSLDVLHENIGFESYEDFCTQVQLSSTISESIKEKMKDLSPQKYLDICIPSSGNKGNGEENSVHTYFFLSHITSASLCFYGLSGKNWKVVNKSKWIPNFQIFENFYKMLENFSKANATFTVYDETEFTSVLQESEISEFQEANTVTTVSDLQNVMSRLDSEYKGDPNRFAFSHKDTKNSSWEFLTQQALWIVYSMDSKWVVLQNGETLSLDEFARGFERLGVKRFSEISSSQMLLDEVKKMNHYSSSWSDIVLKNNALYSGEKSEHKCKYFLSESWKKSIHITEMNDTSVTFFMGDFTEWSEKTKTSFKKTHKVTDLDMNSFYLFLSENKFTPYKKDKDVVNEEKDSSKMPQRSGSFFKSWLQWCYSMHDLVQGFSSMFSSIENGLQTWNKLKSAKLALAMGKFLPISIYEELQSHVESEEKKTMEDLLSVLTTLDSSVMIPRIDRIIRNKSSQPYEIEAALFAMLSKYGTLYNKKPLNEHRGTYIWYEALGGRVWDELFQKVKKDCADARLASESKKHQPTPFSEELLIENLLSEQAKWKLKPKRRSKIHKDMWWYLWKWINDELEDGKAKAWDKATLAWRIDYTMGELMNGGYANALWALWKVWWKWWSPEDMHAIPFVITSTGIASHMHEKLLVQLTSWMARWTPFTELMFNKDPVTLKIFKAGMIWMIQSLYDSSVVNKYKSLGSDVKKTYDFWNQYGWTIVDRMTGKDGYLFAMKDQEPFKSYYEFINGMQTDDQYDIKSTDINEGAYSFNNTPFTYTAGRTLYSKNIKFPNGVISWETIVMLSNVVDHLKDLKTKDYDRETKKRIYKELYILVHANVSAVPAMYYKGVLDIIQVRNVIQNGIDILGFSREEIARNTPPWENNPVYSYTKSVAFQTFLDKKFEEFMDSSSNNVTWHDFWTEKRVDDILEPVTFDNVFDITARMKKDSAEWEKPKEEAE